MLLDNISPAFIAMHDSGKDLHRFATESYGQRTVQHYEIEYQLSSRGGYILTDGIPILTEAQTVFFRRPGMVVEGIGVYHALFLEFDLDETGGIAPELNALPPVFRNMPEDIWNADDFRRLTPVQEPSAADRLLWKAQVLRLLAFLLSRTEKSSGGFLPTETTARLRQIKNALLYIDRHFREPVTLQDLADAAGYSPYYFCRLFKQLTQLTPMQYIVRYRMEQAKKRLLTSSEPAESIMLDVGFHNYGYFWRTFKELYGLSPQEYRRPDGKGRDEDEI